MFYTDFDEIFDMLRGKAVDSDYHGSVLPSQWLHDRKEAVCSMPSFPHSNVWLSPDMNTLNMEFALAGYSKEEVSVTVNGNTISVRVAPNSAERDSIDIHNGISRKRADFSMNVDKSYDAKKAETSFADGLLRLRMTKVEESRSVKLM